MWHPVIFTPSILGNVTYFTEQQLIQKNKNKINKRSGKPNTLNSIPCEK
jgi:hypothetical protein